MKCATASSCAPGCTGARPSEVGDGGARGVAARGGPGNPLAPSGFDGSARPASRVIGEHRRRVDCDPSVTLIDLTGAPPVADRTVPLRGPIIAAVGGPELPIPAGATVLDGRG